MGEKNERSVIEIKEYRERAWAQYKMPAWLCNPVAFLDFHNTYKNTISRSFKTLCIRPSADVKPMLNDLVHAVPW